MNRRSESRLGVTQTVVGRLARAAEVSLAVGSAVSTVLTVLIREVTVALIGAPSVETFSVTVNVIGADAGPV